MTLADKTIQTGGSLGDAGWLAFLRELVGVNSGFMNVEGQRRMFGMLTPRLARLGFAASAIQLADDRMAMLYELPGAAPEILLVGHVDTMFQLDSPFQTLEQAGPVLTGPGITDMKAGLVLIIELLERLGDSSLLRHIRIFINDDEELGARYSKNALKGIAEDVRFALIFEPGLKDGAYAAGYSAARRRPGGDYALRTAMRYYGRDEIFALAQDLSQIRKGFLSGEAVPLPARMQRAPGDRLDPSGRVMVVGLGPYGGKTHTTDEFLRPETFGERLDAAELLCRTLLTPGAAWA